MQLSRLLDKINDFTIVINIYRSSNIFLEREPFWSRSSSSSVPSIRSRIVFFRGSGRYHVNTVSINEGCFVSHRVRVISVSDQYPSVILGSVWQPNSRFAVLDWWIYPFLIRIHPSSVSYENSPYPLTCLRTHTHARTHLHGVATNINPRGNPTAISYQIISFAGLGNVYARVTVIYGIPREW